MITETTAQFLARGGVITRILPRAKRKLKIGYDPRLALVIRKLFADEALRTPRVYRVAARGLRVTVPELRAEAEARP